MIPQKMHWNGHTVMLLMAINFYKSFLGSNLSRGININTFLSGNRHLGIFPGFHNPKMQKVREWRCCVCVCVLCCGRVGRSSNGENIFYWFTSQNVYGAHLWWRGNAIWGSSLNCYAFHTSMYTPQWIWLGIFRALENWGQVVEPYRNVVKFEGCNKVIVKL